MECERFVESGELVLKTVLIEDGKVRSLTGKQFYTDDMNETWLQETLYQAGDLLNQTSRDSLDPIIPLCRELPLRGSTSTVYLDILAVRASGRPVLIECKLWKNPQARREVIGQILEYGALLQGQSYADVDAQVKSSLKDSGTSIWGIAKRKSDQTISENAFVDHFTNCLIEGSFDLVLAGDGIRSDVKSVVSFLERRQSQINSLHMIEVSVFENGESRLVVAQSPLQISTQRFVQVTANTGDFDKIDSEEEQGSEQSNAETEAYHIRNRQFWDKFINSVIFNHSDQDKPRHGGKNWVKIPFYKPVERIQCFRAKTKNSYICVYMNFNGDNGTTAYERILEQWDDVSSQIPGVLHQINKNGHPEIFIKHTVDITNEATETEQLEWLSTTSNQFIDTFGPIFEAFERDLNRNL